MTTPSGTHDAEPLAMKIHIDSRDANSFCEIGPDKLRDVTGGAATVPNMGGPKYSAQWWELVRSRGLGK
jgi:hypothetical protein